MRKRILKLIHVLSMGWFGLCVGYVLVLTLRQAGVHWWVIFSLSGHSAVLVFLLASVYLFAIFRGATRTEILEKEHPLTSTDYYMLFYDVAPFLGGVAGILGAIGVASFAERLRDVAYGSMGTTFLVWIIADPLIGVIESLLPTSRQLRKEWQEQARLQREKQQREKVILLEKLQRDEEELRSKREKTLEPLSLKLAELVPADGADLKKREYEVVDIGVAAWQIGGLDGMQQLHEMAMRQYKSLHRRSPAIDYVSMWWDGIGQWRNQPLREMGVLVSN